MSTKTRVVKLGPELFAFTSFDNWCDKAATKFSQHGVTNRNTICIDKKGRILRSGKEFMRARDDNSYPVRVYHFDSDYDDGPRKRGASDDN